MTKKGGSPPQITPLQEAAQGRTDGEFKQTGECLCTGMTIAEWRFSPIICPRAPPATRPARPVPEPGAFLIAVTRNHELWHLAPGAIYLVRSRAMGVETILLGHRAADLEKGLAALIHANSCLPVDQRKSCILDILEICLSARVYTTEHD